MHDWALRYRVRPHNNGAHNAHQDRPAALTREPTRLNPTPTRHGAAAKGQGPPESNRDGRMVSMGQPGPTIIKTVGWEPTGANNHQCDEASDEAKGGQRGPRANNYQSNERGNDGVNEGQYLPKLGHGTVHGANSYIAFLCLGVKRDVAASHSRVGSLARQMPERPALGMNSSWP